MATKHIILMLDRNHRILEIDNGSAGIWDGEPFYKFLNSHDGFNTISEVHRQDGTTVMTAKVTKIDFDELYDDLGRKVSER